MSLLSILGLLMLTGIALHLTKKVTLRFVKEVGLLALVVGILGQLIGLFQAFQALESMEEIQKAQLINREIRGKVNVTPEDVQRYYEKHKDEYATPGAMHLRHISCAASLWRGSVVRMKWRPS